jgi:hypothetical protein
VNFQYCVVRKWESGRTNAPPLVPAARIPTFRKPRKVGQPPSWWHKDGRAPKGEPAPRAGVDAYLLEWITKQLLNRECFSEQRDGNCRLVADFAARLSETAPIWYRQVAPVAEWVARSIWSTIRRPDTPFATRLTQGNKREAKGRPSIPPAKPAPQPDNVCRVCGKSVSLGRSYCSECDATTARERIVEIAKIGRVASHAPGPKARRAETQRRHALAKRDWEPSNLPAWLNEETYTSKIQPLLAGIANPVIMTTLGVSVTYAVAIRAGRRRPHPRHWESLAELVGITVSSPAVNLKGFFL